MHAGLAFYSALENIENFCAYLAFSYRLSLRMFLVLGNIFVHSTLLNDSSMASSSLLDYSLLQRLEKLTQLDWNKTKQLIRILINFSFTIFHLIQTGLIICLICKLSTEFIYLRSPSSFDSCCLMNKF